MKPLKQKSCCCLAAREEDLGGFGGGRYTGGIHTVTYPEERVLRDIRFVGQEWKSQSWWCHFDDDNYVNVPRLVRMLDDYNPTQDWYLGKPSISSPLEIFLDNEIDW
uniref:Fringe-like glycosyltransferase domain-containing protein n=1 Tax=Anopheles minimus TaxID=112268 RepID=A0A182WC50_9DIPT